MGGKGRVRRLSWGEGEKGSGGGGGGRNEGGKERRVEGMEEEVGKSIYMNGQRSKRRKMKMRWR